MRTRTKTTHPCYSSGVCVSAKAALLMQTPENHSHTSLNSVSQPLQTVINIISVDRATFYYTFQFHSQQADSRSFVFFFFFRLWVHLYPLGVIMIYKDCWPERTFWCDISFPTPPPPPPRISSSWYNSAPTYWWIYPTSFWSSASQSSFIVICPIFIYLPRTHTLPQPPTLDMMPSHPSSLLKRRRRCDDEDARGFTALCNWWTSAEWPGQSIKYASGIYITPGHSTCSCRRWTWQRKRGMPLNWTIHLQLDLIS